jgi:hypothetical protein
VTTFSLPCAWHGLFDIRTFDFPALGNGYLPIYYWRYTPSPWSIGIIGLERKCNLIYGLQQRTGKILSRKQLGGRNLMSKSLGETCSITLHSGF